MDYNTFIKSLNNPAPPAECNKYLKALWFEKNGDWDKAHEIVQDIHTSEGSWIHAYLHRVEGDESNAGYWYFRAKQPFCKLPLKEEWEQLLNYFL